MLIAIASYAQFADTVNLNNYIRDTIKDRRPNKVTANQVQTALFGLSKFLGVTKTDTALIKSITHDSASNKVKYSDTAAALLNYRNAIIKNTDSIAAHNIRIGASTSNIQKNVDSITSHNLRIIKTTDSIAAHNVRLGANTTNIASNTAAIALGKLNSDSATNNSSYTSRYQSNKTGDSLQLLIAANTNAIGTKWGLTGNSGNNYLTNFIGNNDNISLRFRTNNLEAGKFDSLSNFVVGKGSIIGQQLVDPANQRSVQYAGDGSYPAILQVTTSDSIGCVNCTVNGSNITSDSIKRVGLEISAFNENSGMSFIHFKKARGNWLNPRGVRTNDVLGGIAGWGYLGDQSNFSGSVVGFHFVAYNNFTAAQQSTGIDVFVNNATARRHAFYINPDGKINGHDSTSGTYNALDIGVIRAFGQPDIWASDMILGAESGVTTRSINSSKLIRLVVPPYVANGAGSPTTLAIGLNTSTDNIVYLGGGSSAYAASTQLNFYTASALATTTGTLRMRINSAGNVGIGASTSATIAGQLQVVDSSASGTRGIFLTENNTSTSSSIFSFQKSRGTPNAPTAVATADFIGLFDFKGYAGSGNLYQTGARVNGIVDGTVTDASVGVPMNIIFSTSDGTTFSEKWRVSKNGYLSNTAANGTSTLTLAGSFAPAYIGKATSYTATISDHTIEVTATGQTITLPTAVGISGREYTVKLTASGTGTVATTSSQTIDGSTTFPLTAQYKYVTIQSNNANWIIIANN